MYYDIYYRILEFVPTFRMNTCSTINHEWYHIIKRILKDRMISPPMNDSLIRMLRMDRICNKLPKVDPPFKMRYDIDCLSAMGAQFCIDTSKSYIIEIHIKTIADTYLFTLKTPHYWNAIKFCFPINDHQIKFVFPNLSGFIMNFDKFISIERFPVDLNLKAPLPEANKPLVFEIINDVVCWIDDSYFLELVRKGSQFEYRYRAFDSFAFSGGCVLAKRNKDVFLYDNRGNEWNLNSILIDHDLNIFAPRHGSFSLKFDNMDMVWLESISTFLIWVKGACIKFKKRGEELFFVDFLPKLNKVKSLKATYDKYNQILIFHSNPPKIYDCLSQSFQQ